ncbi:MAG: hypothetical protein IPP07_28710 [Holophagales bacterium]|nr:hypothetical protein [Holophagales bacterium]
MPKNVSVDGLGDFEFPDEATDGQIKVYLRKRAGLTPHGTKPTKPQDAPGFDAAQPGIASDTISGMGKTIAPSMAAEDRKVNRGTLPAVGKAAGAALELASEGLSLGMDASGMGKPQQRVGQAIDLFAQQGKTPLENLKYAGGKLVGAAKKTYRDMSNPDGTGPSTVMAGGPPAIAAKFTGNLLDSVDDGRRPDPAGESFVQKRQDYVDAARRVADAKSKGLPVDPADRDLYAQAKAGLLPTAEADPMTGLIAEPMPDRPGGMAESAVRAIAKTPAAIAETFTAPENVAIMGGTRGAMGLASRFLPPPAALAAQMAIGAGTTGYFLNDMSKGAGESIGRVAGGDFDQRFIEEEGPNALANAAFVGHMGATSAKPIAQSVEGIRANSLSVKTEALHNQSLQTAVEKVAANRADGKSIFAGLNKNEVAAYTRTQEAIAKANEAQGNEVQTEPLARDNSVDDAVQIVKQMYGDRPDLKVSIAETAADLPAGLLPVNDTAGTVKAVFNPNTNEVHVVRDRVTSAAELAQKLAHERDHGTTDIPAHQVAGFAEKTMKAELAKLVQEGRLDPAEFERLAKLTGEAFSGEVKRIAADRNHPAQIAADEVMAGMAEQMPAQPGRFAQGMATLASKIPGVQLTEMDARALAAKQAAAKAQPFQPDRPVETLGEAPQLPPVDRAPAPPVEAAPVVAPPFDMTKVSEDIALDRPTSVGFYGFIPAGLIGERPGEIGMVAAVDAAGRPTEIRHQKTGRVVLRDGKPVSVAEYTGTAPAAPVAEAPVAPKESFVGREVTVGGKKARIVADDGSGKFVIQPEGGEPRIWTPNKTSHPSVPQKGERVALPDGTEGVIYSADKTSAAIRFDDGTNKIVPREGLRRVEQTVPPEAPVPQPVEQAAPVQQAEAPLVPSEAPPVDDAAARGRVARALAQPNRDMRRRQLELAMEQPTPEPAPAVDPMELFLQKRTAAVVIPKGEPMPRIAGARFIDVGGKRVVYWPGNPSEKKPFQTNRDLLQKPGGLERALEPKIPAQVTDKQRAQLEAMVDEGASMAEVQAALDRVRSPNPLPEVPPPAAGARYSRSPDDYKFPRAKVTLNSGDKEWREYAENEIKQFGVPRERHDAVDSRGFSRHDTYTDNKIVALYDGTKLTAAARIDPNDGVVWLWGEKGAFNPKKSPFWNEGKDTDSRIGRWLALRDEARPYVKLQREMANMGVRRKEGDGYTEPGARGVNETLIPVENAVNIIDGFSDRSGLIAAAAGLERAYVDKGIADLKSGRYDSPEAMDVVQWAHGELRRGYEREVLNPRDVLAGADRGLPSAVPGGDPSAVPGQPAPGGAADAVGGRGAGGDGSSLPGGGPASLFPCPLQARPARPPDHGRSG